MKTIFKDIKNTLIIIFIGILIGIVCGIIGSLFHILINLVTNFRETHKYILFSLPLLGLLIVLMKS